ncbi:PAS domain S-box-containing protein/diguanylate cyclase (GGDEF) domain-containing protein [Thiomicrospira sp. ALE5]|nr:PAS domain S-box-containing protein/diguanylate cyclase (GGDEF) domain-containing protein [Thiomicrospira sp. ALE5]
MLITLFVITFLLLILAVAGLIWQRRHLVKIKADQRVYEVLFERLREGVVLTDKEKNIVRTNPAFSKITGYEFAEVVNKNPNVLSSGMQDAGFYQKVWDAINQQGFWEGRLWNRNKPGEAYLQKTSIINLASLDHPKLGFMAIQSDITSLVTHEQELNKLLHYDALTGLPNRLQLTKHLEVVLKNAQANSDMVAVLFIDLDGFKTINDKFGHEVGDKVLIQTAQALKTTLGEHAIVSRVGGDEFVAVISHLKNEHLLNNLLNRVQRSISEVGYSQDVLLELSASIGVTLTPENQSEAEQLIRHADLAMYQAKQAGVGFIRFFDLDEDRETKLYRRIWLEVENGFKEGELELFYQPKINMRTGEIVGAEALIRWHHPQKGLVMPDSFLPFIERSYLSETLDQWVIGQALNQLSAWRSIGLEWQLSINITSRSLQKVSFVSNLAKRLKEYGTELASYLEIEVLETSALEDMEHVIAVIGQCHRLGISFALDDFGTGYSSLQYLRDLPVDKIKVDQSFVRKMLQNPNDLSIVSGVISLCRVFNRQVIAEGVETVDHADILLLLGCDFAQGYGIARPMDAGALMVWQAQWQVKPFALVHNQAMFGRGDTNLLRTEVIHRLCVDQVEAYIMGKHEAAPEVNSKQCDLGKWLGHYSLKHDQIYHELKQVHSELLFKAAELIKLCQKGQQSAAQDQLPKLFNRRDGFIKVMRKLHNAVVNRTE